MPQLLSINISPIEPRIKIRNNVIIKYFSWIFTIDTELETFRIKIVIRQKGENQKHFYSCFKLIHYKFPKNNSPDGKNGNAKARVSTELTALPDKNVIKQDWNYVKAFFSNF